MTQFKLLDTGYGDKSRSGTALGVSSRAGYDGTSAASSFTFNVTNL